MLKNVFRKSRPLWDNVEKCLWVGEVTHENMAYAHFTLSTWGYKHTLSEYVLLIAFLLLQLWGKRWRSWLRQCATSRKVAGSIPDGVIGIFHLTLSFRPHYGPGVDSASNRNEYQEYLLGGEGSRCIGLTTLPPSCADCHEIWER